MNQPSSHASVLTWRLGERQGAVTLEAETLVIGRGEDCGLRLDDASVSRRHARLFAEKDRWRLVDLDSSRGTIVNDERLTPGDPHPLAPGDSIVMGKAKLWFGAAPTEADAGVSLPEDAIKLKFREETRTFREDTVRRIEAMIAAPEQAKEMKDAFLRDLDRYHEYVDGKFREYEVLRQITQTIASILDLKQLLSTALELVSRALSADRGFILLYDPAHGSLRSMISRHFDKHSAAFQYDFTFSQTIAKSCFESGEIIMIPDALVDERFRASQSIVASSIRSVVCLPLRKGGDVSGVIYLDNVHRAGCFHQHQTDFLKAFSSQTAIALENARLYTQAVTDGLTRLYNRKYMDERIFEEMVRARRYERDCSLILLDIDRFKEVNDNYGHHAGDQVLEAVADALRENRRSSDILGRYGGEEFLLLLTETNLEGAKVFAERLRARVERLEAAFGEQRIQVTISCGVAAYRPEMQNNLTAFVKEADQALYRAKEEGRNRVCAAEAPSEGGRA